MYSTQTAVRLSAKAQLPAASPKPGIAVRRSTLKVLIPVDTDQLPSAVPAPEGAVGSESSVAAEAITEEEFRARLFTAACPDPDVLIRTSGEQRLSNFLLWQVAYAELYISSVLWPDFGRADLYEANCDFQRRDRRFGRVGT